MNAYTFHREDGFYLIELRNDAEAKSGAVLNPGTLKVIRHFPPPETVIWDQSITTHEPE